MRTQPLHRGGRARLPRGASGAIALIVLFEALLAWQAGRIATLTLAQYQFARAACRGAASSEVLCFGDSQVKMGLSPQVIEAASGHRTYNLALAGSQPPAAYLLLRRLLERGARPRSLIIGYHPDNLKFGPSNSLIYLAEFFGVRDGLEFARAERSASLAALLAVHSLLPSFHHRPRIRAEALSLVDGKRTLEARTLAGFRRNWDRNRGAQMLPKNGESATAVRFWDEPDLSDKWSCHPVNAVYLRRFLDLADDRGIAVFWLAPPMHPRIAAERRRLGRDVEFSRFLARGCDRHPRLVVLDGRERGYEAPVFVDSSHLDRDGATALSLAVADALGRDPARVADGRRWLGLTAPRGRPIAVRLEDLTESTVALEPPSGVRR